MISTVQKSTVTVKQRPASRSYCIRCPNAYNCGVLSLCLEFLTSQVEITPSTDVRDHHDWLQDELQQLHWTYPFGKGKCDLPLGEEGPGHFINQSLSLLQEVYLAGRSENSLDLESDADVTPRWS